MWMHLGMAKWCIPFWVTVSLTLTPDLISRLIVSMAYLIYFKLLPSNVSYARQFFWWYLHVSVTFLVFLFLRTVVA